MPAVFTLATSALPTAIAAADPRISTEAITGLAEGMFLYIDRELIKVVSVNPTSRLVHARRGVGGTVASAHAAGATTYLVPTGDMVYEQDPAGPPPPQPYVIPWINTTNGKIFWPVGDETGPGAGGRFWQQVTAVPGFSSLGIRTVTYTPTAAT